MALQPDTDLSLGCWDVQSLRATTFHPRAIDLQLGTQWWETVVGESPEQVLIRPKEKLARLSGVLDENQVALMVRPERVDWGIQAAVEDSSEEGQDIETLGHLANAIDAYSKLFDNWLGISPDVLRLAFGAVLVRKIEDHASANRVFSRFLPDVTLDEMGSEDFLYQINRPRESHRMPGLRINRLTKWSVMQFGTISLEFGPSSGHLTSGPQGLACQLELDINTPAKSTEVFLQEEVGLLFQELVELGKELAREGDIP